MAFVPTLSSGAAGFEPAVPLDELIPDPANPRVLRCGDRTLGNVQRGARHEDGGRRMSGHHCAATRSNGGPCGAYAISGSEYCFHHDPASADEAREARRLGGERRRREAVVTTSFDLPPVDDPEFPGRLAEILVSETLALPNSVKRNQLIKECLKIAIAQNDARTVHARLDRLEDVVDSLPVDSGLGDLEHLFRTGDLS